MTVYGSALWSGAELSSEKPGTVGDSAGAGPTGFSNVLPFEDDSFSRLTTTTTCSGGRRWVTRALRFLLLTISIRLRNKPQHQ